MFLIGLVFSFFHQFIFFKRVPIPADTILGMYHPFRDVVWDGFKSGVPFKNFLITDPVRQTYIWRRSAIESFKRFELPVWNPYSFSGMPLLANFQTAAFYPLNILFFIGSFPFVWGVLIMLQMVLSAVFLYYFLKNQNLNSYACLLGAISFSFSGFMISWLEWNTIGHVVLWLPLILLSIDKIIILLSAGNFKSILFWLGIFLLSLISSFFAGHLQIFSYVFLLSTAYLIFKILLLKHSRRKVILYFSFVFLVFTIITSVQWFPTLRLFSISARSYDLAGFLQQGWFIPWQNLIQFISPDFFGNPATQNYWGEWNYGEFAGYAGVTALIFSFYALFFRRDKKTMFFGSAFFLSLIFALPTSVAKIPFIMKIPLISSSQPTRLMFIIDFTLSVLAGLGLDLFLKIKKKSSVFMILFILGLIFILLWLIVSLPDKIGLSEYILNLQISRRNMILPSFIFFSAGSLIFLLSTVKNNFAKQLLPACLILLLVFELFRSGLKFTPFSKSGWIFPNTSTIQRILNEKEPFRFMSLDRRVMPPNFSAFYKIQDVAGYDPLYLTAYSQLVSSWNKGEVDNTQASFNRIITPDIYGSFLTDYLGVKYILSYGPSKSEKLKFLFSEGETYLYENTKVFPRVFLVEKVIRVKSRKDELEQMFQLKDGIRKIAFSSENISQEPAELNDEEYAEIEEYRDNYIKIKVKSLTERLMVVTDIFYPSWKVEIDGRIDKIYRVNFTFRGVMVARGEHIIEFSNHL